jgi:hypothetical protein
LTCMKMAIFCVLFLEDENDTTTVARAVSHCDHSQLARRY